MAGTTVKTVKVVVAGDSSGASGALDSLSQKSASVASTMKSHLSGIFSALSATGVAGPFGEVLNTMSGMTDAFAEKAKNNFDKVGKAGIAIAGLGGGLMALSSSQVQAQAQLKTAISDTGESYSDYKDKIEEVVKQQQGFGHTTTDSYNALQTLTSGTGSTSKALEYMTVTANLAAAKHESLADAATQVAKVLNGNGTKVLAQYGINVKASTQAVAALSAAETASQKSKAALAAAQQRLSDLEAIDHTKKTLSLADQFALRDAMAKVSDASAVYQNDQTKLAAAQDTANHATLGHGAAIDQLSQRLNGQASAAVSGFTGQLRVLGTQVQEQVSDFGAKYGPALAGVGAGLTVTAKLAQGAKSGIDLLSGAMKAGTVAQEGLAAAEDASAASADGLAVSEGAADAAGLPLIATIGLIVLAVAAVIAIIYLLVTHWSAVFNAIKSVVMDAVNFIGDHWKLIVDIMLGPIGVIITNWGKVTSFFSKLPGEIVGFFSHLGSDFEHVGEDIINGIVSGIGHMGGAIMGAIKSHLPGGGVIGSALGAIGLAEGGIVTKPTLAMVGEAGYPEAVIPLKGGATVKGLNDAVGELTGMPAGGSSGSGSGHSFQVQQIINLPTGTPEDFAQETTWQLARLVS